MKAIDELVARRVMGLDTSTNPEHTWKLGENGEVDTLAMDCEPHNGPMCTRCDYSYCEHCERKKPHDPCVIPIRPYSTSIEAAWEVVEKMRADFVAVSTTMNSEEYEWVVDMTMNKPYASAQHKSLPMAMCVACLLAKEVDEDEITAAMEAK